LFYYWGYRDDGEGTGVSPLRREAGAVQPEEEMAEEWGDLTNAFKYLKSRWQMGRARLFLVVLCNRSGGSGHKQKNRKFHLNMREIIFPLRVTALEQAAQRGCGDIQDLPGCPPVCPAVGNLL